MKNIISVPSISAIVLAGLTALPFTLMGSTASACTGADGLACQTSVTARTGGDLGNSCEFVSASIDGRFELQSGTVVVGGKKTAMFKSVGANGDRGSVRLFVRGQSTVSMAIDPVLRNLAGTDNIDGVTMIADYDNQTSGALASVILNRFGGATVFTGGGAGMQIDASVPRAAGTQELNFQVGGKAYVQVATNGTRGTDPRGYLERNTSYNIKHIVTCTQ